MDPTTSTFSFTQVILVWTLLGLLLTWLITFIVLALRSFVAKKTEWEDTATKREPCRDIGSMPVKQRMDSA